MGRKGKEKRRNRKRRNWKKGYRPYNISPNPCAQKNNKTYMNKLTNETKVLPFCEAYAKLKLKYPLVCVNTKDLGPEYGVAIGQNLSTNNSVKRLDLRWNNLGPEGGVAIGQSLQTNNTLQKLFLVKNYIGPEGGVAIGRSLQTNNSLQILDLRNNKLGPEGGVAIGRGLQTNSSLQILDLRNNKLGPEGGVAIGRSLQTNNSLQILDLRNNKLGPEAGVAIGLGLQTNSSLQILYLSKNNLGHKGGVVIGQSLQTNSSLQILDLDNNKLGPDDGVAIGRSLQTNSSLKRLNLYNNNLGPQGGVAIGRGLQTNSSLQKLYFDRNNLGPEGGVEIGRSLQTNSSLLELYLSDNNLNSESGIAIGQSLQNNNTIEKLFLNRNNLGNEGARAVIQGIAVNNQNTRITTLNLCYNNMTRLPAELSQCPTTLTKFCYYDNPIDNIPPNVQRWLDRFQQQQNAQIHQDSQNVHNRQIQQCIKDSLNKIINATDAPKYQSLEEVRNVIVNDPILSAQCKTQLIEYALDNSEHTGLGVTFCEALQYVFTRIDVNEESGDEIKRILNQEMNDALCKCFTGRISRLLNCLTAIDPLVNINIVNLNDVFNNVGERLIKEDRYTTEAHQSQFEKELQEDYGYELTEEFRKELEENFYSQLDYFYDVFELKVESSDVVEG